MTMPTTASVPTISTSEAIDTSISVNPRASRSRERTYSISAPRASGLTPGCPNRRMVERPRNGEAGPGARLASCVWLGGCYHLPLAGQEPLPTTVQLRVIVPSAARAIVNTLPDVDVECTE